jgi:type IV fimbrial biogenesis protein FimT
MRRDAGFTLVELLVTMAVAAVLLGIGMPAFGSLIQESRLTTTTNRWWRRSTSRARRRCVTTPV